jgi:UDPglucose 6-dehydrogenase
MIDEMLAPGKGRVEVIWNPEFLREGSAVEDTLRPDRIVVGTVSVRAVETIREVYRALTDSGIPLLITDLPTSELAKGATNAFLATKISFINAMADICAAAGGDISALASALGLDPRIGKAFLKAGIGYGGACLPKDVRGLGTFAEEVGAQNATMLLSAVDIINSSRSGQVVGLVQEAIGGIERKRVAVWGATFKADTDDVRDSPGLQVASQLHSLGAKVFVYDPMGSGNALMAFPELTYANSAIAAAANAEAIAVVTAWPEFAKVDAMEVARVVSSKVLVDACQGVSIPAWQEAGWRVFSLTGIPSKSEADGDGTAAS